MKKFDWKTLGLNPDVLPDMISSDRAVLWVRRGREGRFLLWERVGTVVGAETIDGQGLRAIPATSMPARQPVRGLLGKLIPRLGARAGGPEWRLPNGDPAERCGERRTDLILVWTVDESDPADESRLRALWPSSQGVEKLGRYVALVSGVESRTTPEKPEPSLPQGSPLQQAEGLLSAARAAGDRRREASALTDLGIVLLRGGDSARAATVLEDALRMVIQIGDRSLQGDVMGNLGLALLGVEETDRGMELVSQALEHARQSGNRFAEKSALDRLGLAHATRRHHEPAISAYESALALAHEVGDQQHAAELLWSLAIEHAELNHRDRAVTSAHQAVELLRAIGNPQAPWFDEHLRKYRAGHADSPGQAGGRGPDDSSNNLYGGSVQTSSMSAQPGPVTTPGPATTGPGLLSMALSAAEAMAKFLGSGLKTTTQETYHERLRKCGSCEHHTGVRCRVCGCITSIKARMPHEKCPVARWPS